MTACDLETSVPDWILEHPGTWDMFREWGIDCSCGGKSLAYACQERGLDGAVVLASLHRCLDQDENP
jgi:regulator of cell morphogenesis and NO signaling